MEGPGQEGRMSLDRQSIVLINVYTPAPLTLVSMIDIWLCTARTLHGSSHSDLADSQGQKQPSECIPQYNHARLVRVRG